MASAYLGKLVVANLYRGRINADIEELNEMTRSLFSCLNNEVKRLEVYAEKEKSKMLEEEANEFWDWMSEDYWRYAEGFPNTLGYLLFAKYYSFLESGLHSICFRVQAHHSTNLKDFQVPRVIWKLATILRYVRYLKDAGIEIDEQTGKKSLIVLLLLEL